MPKLNNTKQDFQGSSLRDNAMMRQISYQSDPNSPGYVPVNVENMDDVQTEELQSQGVLFAASNPHIANAVTYGRLRLHPSPRFEDHHCH